MAKKHNIKNTKTVTEPRVLKATKIANAVHSTLSPAPVQHTGDKNQTWDDVEDVYLVCAHGLAEVGEAIQNLVRNLTLNEDSKKLVDNETVSLVKGLSSDIHSFTDTLITIHERHKGKTGLILSDVDHANSVNIAIDYMEFNERFRSVTVLPLVSLTEKLAAASDIERRKKLEAVSEEEDRRLKDPSVISDVEIITENKG